MILDNPYHRRKVKAILKENRELKEELAKLRDSSAEDEINTLKVQLRVAKMHLGKVKSDYEKLKKKF